MSSFTFNRNNNKVVKKNISFTANPKINNNSFALANSNLNLSVLNLGGSTVTTSGAQLNYIDDVPNTGIAISNKAIIPDNNLDISNINVITCNSLTVNGNNITGGSSNSVSDSNSPYLEKIIAGKVQNSKALVTDNNRNIDTINKLSINQANISDNKIITSNNTIIRKKIHPLTWTINETTYSNNLVSICRSDELGLFVAISSNSSGNQIMTSPNGLNWTLQSTPLDRRWTSICWSSELSLFVAVCNSSYINYSTMTANSSNGWVASASSNLTNWEAWKAFDSSISTGWHTTESPIKYSTTTGTYTGTITTTDSTNTIHSGEWLQIQLDSPILLTDFAITPRQQYGDQRSPRSFVILGSNNGSTWNLLFTETNKNDWPSDNGPAVTFTITNTITSYSYYRIVVKRIGNLDSGMTLASSLQIMNWNLNPEPTDYYTEVIYSSNGITWERSNPNIKTNWNSICWAPELSLFVAVGNNANTTTTGNRVMTSPDAINWTSRTETRTNNWTSICWSTELALLVAVSNTGTNDRVMVSSDGITWSVRTPTTNNNWTSVCWSKNTGYFVAVSNTGTNDRIMTSPNGTTWTTRINPENNNWNAILNIPNFNLLIAVASSGTNRIMYSENAIEWYTTSSNLDANLNGIAWSSTLQKLVLISSNSPTESKIINSKIFNENLTLANLGKSYNIVNNTNTKFINRIINNTYGFSPYANIWVEELGIFIMGGNGGKYAISTDGAVWTTYSLPVTNQIEEICWSPELSLLVMVCSSTTNNVFTSTDGIFWIARSNGTSYNSNIWTSVCWSSQLSLFVAVSSSGSTSTNRLMTSPDGINWTARTTSVGNTWTSVCWSPELSLFVAVGSTTNNNIISSSDGITWTVFNSKSTGASNEAFTSICWSPELMMFAAVSTNRVIISQDGKNWNYKSSGVNNVSWQSICWAKKLSLFLAVSSTGSSTSVLMFSYDGNIWKSIGTTDSSTTGFNSISWSEKLNTFLAAANNKTLLLNNWEYHQYSLYPNNNLTNLSNYNNYFSNSNYDTWYNTHSNINNEWSSICYSTDLALAVAVSKTGSSNRVMTSSDGISWTSRTTPVSNSSSTPNLSMKSIASGQYHSLAILSNGTVKAWGYNQYGQLGDNTITQKNSPIDVLNLNNVISVATFRDHNLALLSDGTLRAWGYNQFGQLGDNTTTQQNTPVQVSGITNAIDIATGGYHSLALLSDGTLRAWGVNSSGQLGDNTTTLRNIPVQVSGITNAIAISGGLTHSLALLSDGTIRAWGANSNRQLGDGTSNTRYIPVQVSGITNAISIAAGESHSLALLSDGTIKAWGKNFNGQLGDGTTTSSGGISIPVQVLGISNAIAISAGNNFSLALLSDGTIRAWGSNTNRQLGNGTYVDSSIPVQVLNITNAISIEGGGNFGLALLSDGTLKSWGRSAFGELGYGGTSTPSSPVSVRTSATDASPLSNIKINIIVSNSENNWTSICWASELDLFVAVANTGTEDRVMTSPDGITWTSRTSAADNEWTAICWSPELNLLVAVASSGTGNRVMTSTDGINWTLRTSAADNNWTAVCWSPELNLFVAVASSGSGNRIMTSSNGINWTIQTSPADNDWTSVCWSYYDNLFIAVASSGSNNRVMSSSDGINWSTSMIYKPTTTITTSMNSIEAGNDTSIVVMSDNTIRCWGTNANTKFGSISSPMLLPNNPSNEKSSNGKWNNIIKALSMSNVVVVLLSNGQIQTRGLNTNGELGIANALTTKGNSYNGVNTIPEIANAIDIEVGESHVLALLSDGTVKSWGLNTSGQLGDNSTTLRETPVNITELTNVTSISSKVGAYHSLALLSNGTIKSWGLNTNGQLGNGNTTQQNLPVNVTGISNAIAISVGASHSLALLSDGTIKAWGLNTSGQLGDGTTNQQTTPVTVSGINNAIAIAAGYNHSLALLADGTIKSWGANLYGQLGNSTNIQSLSPVTVTGISNAIAISAGNQYSICLLNDSTVRTWGYNNNGQLGNNSTTNSNMPISVLFNSTTTNLLRSININTISNTNYINNNWKSITWSPDMKLYVAISNSGNNRIMISNNGITWYSKPMTTNNNWTSICWADLLSIFIGISTNNSNNIIYSNIAGNSLLNTVQTLSSNQIGYLNNRIMIGGSSISNTNFTITADSNNNILRLTNNSSNSVDFTVTPASSQLNIINNSSNKIINIVNHDSSTQGLKFNGELLPVTSNELNILDSTSGSVESSKAIILDESKNINNINNLSVNTLVVDNKLILNSSDNNNPLINSITPGIAEASKLLVLDSNRNISQLNKITSNNIKFNTVNTLKSNLDKTNYDLGKYYFGNVRNEFKYPSNLNAQSICWSPELEIFVMIGKPWDSQTNNKAFNTFWINYSYDGINWMPGRHSIVNASTSSDFNSIVWSPFLSLFVAIFHPYMIGYSSDGINWTINNISSVTTTSYRLSSITWSPELKLFAATSTLGTNRIITSPDGINWTLRTTSVANDWISITWGNGLFVAVSNTGTTNRVMTSPNGTTWTSRTSASSNNWTCVTYGNNLFVAVANSGTGNRVMTSSDGITWTSRTSAADNNWQTVIWANNLFIAGANSGTNNRIMTSPDGITWTIRSTTDSNIDYYCMTYSPSLNLIVAGANGNGLSSQYAYNKIATSPNSINWTLQDTSYDLGWCDMIYVNELGLYIAIGQPSSYSNKYNKQLAYSSDAINWTFIKINNTTSISLKKIVWSSSLGMLIAITSNTFYTSIDGINWTTISSGLISGGNWNYIIWIDELSKFIAVGDSGINRAISSSDGQTWSAITLPTSLLNSSIDWSPSLNLAIITTKITSSTLSTYYTSSDCINWTERTFITNSYSGSANNNYPNISWISELNMFIYNSYYLYSYISYDGINWIESRIQVPNNLISYGSTNNNFKPVWINKLNKLYIMRSTDTYYYSTIFESSDGITWNKLYSINSFHANYTHLYYDNINEKLIIYGPETISTPIQPFLVLDNFTDPIDLYNISSINKLNSYNNQASIDSVTTWINQTAASNNNWTSICYSFDKNLYVAVSNSGTNNRVMTSSDAITWTSRTSAANNNWTSICYSQDLGLFVAVANSGTGNRVMTSSDAITWTARTSPADNNWSSICWSTDLGLFVAVANSGTGNRIMTSTNGQNWELRQSPINNDWNAICWSDELEIFVAVASSGTGDRVMTSYDGITWTSRTSAVDNNWTSISWSLELGLFAAVSNTGTDNRVMTSPDGITWTSRTSASNNNWVSICWASELNLFIAIANSGTNNRIMTSFDGIIWTSRANSIDNDWTSICWSSGYNQAVAISNTGTTNRVLTSTICLPYPKSNYIAPPNTLYVNQANGNVGIGTINPNYQLQLSTNSAGKPSTSVWSVSSDKRLKENIEDADLDTCYDNIKKLRLVKYTWKDELYNNEIPSEDERTQLGWIADEVAEIFPKAVRITKNYNYDDCKSLDPDQIIASLYGTAKKLLNEYESQKNKIQNLKEELSTLESFVNQLDIQ